MRNPALRLSEPDPALLQKLALIEQGYLAVVALISLGALGAWLNPALSHLASVDWSSMGPQVAICALLSATALELCQTRQSALMQRVGLAIAAIVALLSFAALLKSFTGFSIGIESVAAVRFGALPPVMAGAFLALADAIMLLRARRGAASHLADLLVFISIVVVLVMTSGYMLKGLSPHLPGAGTSILDLLALALLVFVGFLRRAELGAYATFLGEGSGSRIARLAAPLVLLIPFLPQTALLHAVQSGRIRVEYLSTAAAFLTAGLSAAVMLYMAWKINRLESKIRDLSLRDELTGLYNRRGFHLVAWQALRQARRTGLPFSVMFIVVEDPPKGSAPRRKAVDPEKLIGMAEILKGAFRDNDVLGRIDPEVFALAGHFGEKAIAIMRLRLQEAVNYRNADPGRSFDLAFSIGCINAGDPRLESLEDLLAKADNARDQELSATEPLAPAGSPETK